MVAVIHQLNRFVCTCVSAARRASYSVRIAKITPFSASLNLATTFRSWQIAPLAICRYDPMGLQDIAIGAAIHTSSIMPAEYPLAEPTLTRNTLTNRSWRPLDGLNGHLGSTTQCHGRFLCEEATQVCQHLGCIQLRSNARNTRYI
jgi:hypothetical protein